MLNLYKQFGKVWNCNKTEPPNLQMNLPIQLGFFLFLSANFFVVVVVFVFKKEVLHPLH